MIIRFHKNFEKKVKNLSANSKKKLKERLHLFLLDIYHPILNNHPLKGKYQGYFSINITGDLRALYKMTDSQAVIFIDLDTHSNLYG